MSITQIRSEAFDRSVGPLMHLFSEEQIRKIAGMEPDDSLDERLEYLAGRSNEGALTAEDRAEHEGYARANQFLSVLKAKARKSLRSAVATPA